MKKLTEERKAELLAEINALGKEITPLLEGKNSMVVIQVTASLFVGACVSGGLDRNAIESLVDYALKYPALSAQLGSVQ